MWGPFAVYENVCIFVAFVQLFRVFYYFGSTTISKSNTPSHYIGGSNSVKNKRSKSLLVATSLTIAMTGILSACSKSTDTTDAPSTASTVTSPSSTTGFPIVTKPLTLKMLQRIAPNAGPSKDLLVWNEYEKKTGIKVIVEDVPTEGFSERKNLVFASNELPDFFFRAALSPNESLKYGTSGQLIPLEKLIEQYAPNFKALMDKYPEIKAGITFPNGHIYTLPMIVTTKASLVPKLWLNKKWLDKLGLKQPQTTDELISVLKAFRDGDPNGNGKADEIPLSTQPSENKTKDNISLVNFFAGSFGLDLQFDYRANIENGKVKLWSTDDRFKALLQFLNTLWKEKLIDREYFTQTNAQYIAKMSSGRMGEFSWGNNNPFAAIADQYVQGVPVKGPLGDQKFSVSDSITKIFGTFAITNVNKQPEATMRWIDYFYGQEGSTFIRYGVEGQTFNYDANGEAVYVDAIAKDPKPDAAACAKVSPYCGGAFPHWLNEKNDSLVNNQAVVDAQKVLDPYLPKVKYGVPLFDEATSKNVEILRNDIDTYVIEQTAKFIIGDLDFSKWDNYVATLKKMKIDELEGMYQSVYDNLQSKK